MLSLGLSVVFIALGIIHLNWARGGEWGFENALPMDEFGNTILNPRPIHSAVVGFGLLLFASCYIFQSSHINIDIPQWITKIGRIPSKAGGRKSTQYIR
jgi:hypothetical protein